MKMKAYELSVKVTSHGTLELPEKLLKKLPRDRAIGMILLIPEQADTEDDAAWDRLTAEQFFSGYDEADSVYDHL